ncbi:unnamed protein product [Paramecium octaurelia]|uniref:Uncharacterized protein n=1 Tax=Paramecium octaurelia TaxID=43137 RepID=A0A8S1TW02_PAROT|nr:unnamed protein product [Paramecium octaurelia]
MGIHQIDIIQVKHQFFTAGPNFVIHYFKKFLVNLTYQIKLKLSQTEQFLLQSNSLENHSISKIQKRVVTLIIVLENKSIDFVDSFRGIQKYMRCQVEWSQIQSQIHNFRQIWHNQELALSQLHKVIVNDFIRKVAPRNLSHQLNQYYLAKNLLTESKIFSKVKQNLLLNNKGLHLILDSNKQDKNFNLKNQAQYLLFQTLKMVVLQQSQKSLEHHSRIELKNQQSYFKLLNQIMTQMKKDIFKGCLTYYSIFQDEQVYIDCTEFDDKESIKLRPLQYLLMLHYKTARFDYSKNKRSQIKNNLMLNEENKVEQTHP